MSAVPLQLSVKPKGTFDPIETFETLASPVKVWVFKLSGIRRKISLVKIGKQEHRD